MSARWWELSCPACSAWSAGIPSAGASDPGRGHSTRAGTSLCGRVRFARAGTGILSPDAQDVPGCTGLSPWMEVGGGEVVVERAGLRRSAL